MLVWEEEAHEFLVTLARAVNTPYNVFSPPLYDFGNRDYMPLNFGDAHDFKLEKHFAAAL